jgi:uridylate kinase
VAAPRRVLLKLSGEGLGGRSGSGYSRAALRSLGAEIAALPRAGIQAAVVVGAGNLVRGRDLPPDLVDRTAADAAGMLATVANALVLAEAIRRAGARARVLTAVPMPDVAESFTAERARERLDAGETVLLAGGTGRPYFTTDTAAALRALEIHAEAFLMAKNGVEGVYDADPRVEPDARFLPEITHHEAIEKRLGVMDSTALSLCRDNELPIYVFNMDDERNIDRIVCGERVGTVVST